MKRYTLEYRNDDDVVVTFDYPKVRSYVDGKLVHEGRSRGAAGRP